MSSEEANIVDLLRRALDPDRAALDELGFHDDDDVVADRRTPQQRERDATAKLGEQIQGQDDAELINLQDEHGTDLADESEDRRDADLLRGRDLLPLDHPPGGSQILRRAGRRSCRVGGIWAFGLGVHAASRAGS